MCMAIAATISLDHMHPRWSPGSFFLRSSQRDRDWLTKHPASCPPAHRSISLGEKSPTFPFCIVHRVCGMWTSTWGRLPSSCTICSISGFLYYEHEIAAVACPITPTSGEGPVCLTKRLGCYPWLLDPRRAQDPLDQGSLNRRTDRLKRLHGTLDQRRPSRRRRSCYEARCIAFRF